MVFVESGGRGDFYFNYAHNCNAGIRKAMEYNPKWVVLSNDDMYKIDDIGKLINTLDKLDNRTISAVFAHPSSYHSKSEILGEVNLFAHIYYLRNKYSILYISSFDNTTHFGLYSIAFLKPALQLCA